MAHEHGSVGPCMCAQCWYWSSLVIYMFLTLISRDGGNFRTQLNFFRVLCSYYWYLSQASINDRDLDWQWNWAWFFQQNYSTISILICLRYPFETFWSTIFLVSQFHILSWTGFLTGNWRTSIKNLISPCCSLIWAVYETFWMKNLNQLVNQCDTQKIYGVLHGRHLTFLCWYYWHNIVAVFRPCTGWNMCYHNT